MTQQIERRINELVDRYTGPDFKGCSLEARGCHLVRALDEEVYNQLFAPWKPTVEYERRGPNDILIKIIGYSPKLFSIHIRDNKDVTVDL